MPFADPIPHPTPTRLVIDTLTPMDGERKAFRLIGGILVERTVADVLPDVTHNHGNVSVFPVLRIISQFCT